MGSDPMSMLARLRPLARVATQSPAMLRRSIAYSMVRIDVHDQEEYAKYAAIAGPTVAEFGGEFLARGGATTQLEGEGRERNVIIKWPDTETALRFYNSAGYQKAMSYGLPASS